ncbi:MAG: hypothetical protein FD156_2281 [Nitrospirae bacterium]|nr:MAG: hypothetical protein FD156_2281 [Nitrospirota bacterium]
MFVIASSKNLVILSFIFLVVFISITKYADYDLWWHLKLGETIYNTGNVYKADEFSYTFNGQPQFNAEWLADLIIYISYKAGGLICVNILKASILLLTFLFLFMTMKNLHQDENAGFYATIITLVLVLLSIRFRLFVRPYLFSYLFLPIFLFIISHYEKKRNIKILYFLPLIEIVWANMSAGAVFGPLIFSLFVIGEFIEKRTNSMLLIVLAAVIASSLFNPEMENIYSLVLKLASDPYSKTVGEYQPVSLQLLWGYGFGYTFGYQILAIGSIIYFVFMRGWKNIYHLLLFIVFFIESLLQVRIIEFFSFVSVIFFANPIEKLLKSFSPVLAKKTITNLVISILILAIAALSLKSKIYSFGIGIKERAFPDSAIAFLEKENIKGKMFNSYSLGGYIIWSSPSDRKVFIDGRYRRLYSPDFYNNYLKMLSNTDEWKSAEQKWGFDYALLEYDLKDSRYPKHINENADWALVYWDDHSAVYLKRIEKNLGIIEKYEYKITKPSFNDFSYLQQYLHSGNAHAAVEQINKEISLNPENQEPRLAKAFLLYNMGSFYHDEVLRELEICLKLKPDLSAEHSAIAFILINKGLIDKAKDEIKKASRINPDDPGAVYLKERLNPKRITGHSGQP